MHFDVRSKQTWRNALQMSAFAVDVGGEADMGECAA
jgi:hypothetical protein